MYSILLFFFVFFFSFVFISAQEKNGWAAAVSVLFNTNSVKKNNRKKKIVWLWLSDLKKHKKVKLGKRTNDSNGCIYNFFNALYVWSLLSLSIVLYS